MSKVENFVFQENQYRGALLPCTLEDFNRIVESQDVAWRIGKRQEVENAIAEGLPLDDFLSDSRFQMFCKKHSGDAGFQQLGVEKQLTQWANDLKMGLPCFIFGAKEFTTQQRKLEGIKLSSFFMFDADHLPISPKELFERTQAADFPWTLCLAHITSSGHGLRLVCVSKPELGNIADNQVCLARQLGILDMMGTTGKPVTDDSCIDASRISYAPRRQDILFIDEKLMFEGEDGDSQMEVLYGNDYRQGRGHCNPTHSENRFHEDQAPAKVKSPEPAGEADRQQPLVFGYPVMDYINKLLPKGVPEGSRHKTAISRVDGDLLYVDDIELPVSRKYKEAVNSL